MKLILNLSEGFSQKTALALGMFDGLHLGHRAVLAAAQCLADENALLPGAFSFSSHPLSLLDDGGEKKLLLPAAEKAWALKKAGMGLAVLPRFSEELKNIAAEDFIALLCENYGAKAFAAGEDHRFGRGGKGDAALLRRLSGQMGFALQIVPELSRGGERLSSSAIRGLLQGGDLERANALLGQPYALWGRVVPGQRLARTLGFPTANLRLRDDKLLPKFGVYAGFAVLGRARFPAVCNVGLRPSVPSAPPATEAHLIGFSGDAYGSCVKLELLAFLRPELKFDGLEALQAQVLRDLAAARAFLAEKAQK
ncbi:MAG: riboflavin biosynthesis protein RibF [Christensenellaceae bacterium]|jgi:riboflavin kinase/FMN adenylyltransferase|nr:riboflavin biosynthesis protein RibF [Christensenellaceae bacterium]